MKLLYIGTGAADWTQAAGARDGVTRRFTCTLVDEALLIDLAPTTPAACFEDGGVFAGVTDILYTHSHDDHYDRDTLARLASHRPVRVWASAHFASRIPTIEGVEVHSLTAGVTVQVAGYEITPLCANHRISAHPDEQALHYIISDGARRIFWGADGAWLPTETWYALRAARPYDRIVMDGTLGEVTGDYRIFEHNSLPMLRLMADSFRAAGCVAEGGRIYLTHLSRDAHDSPLVMDQKLAADNFYVAKDNLEDVF